MIDELGFVNPSNEEPQGPDESILASKFDFARYLISQLQEKYSDNNTVKAIVQDCLLNALNKENGHISDTPLLNFSTYYPFYYLNHKKMLNGIAEFNTDNSVDWKVSFDTDKGNHYEVEFAGDILKYSVSKEKKRSINWINIGKDVIEVITFDEKLDDDNKVISQSCDVNWYDPEKNQVPVPNRLDAIRCARNLRQLYDSKNCYELLGLNFSSNQVDRYAFVGPISLNDFYREFEKLILPAGIALNLDHPDSRLLDNKCRFMNLCGQIEKQLGISKSDDIFEDKGTVLLSEALVEPISSHFGVIDDNPLYANGLAIIKKPNGNYSMLTIDISKKDWTYDVSSMKEDCTIEKVLHALNRNSRNKNLEGLSDFIDGRKLDCSLTFKLPPVVGGYRNPLLPPKPGIPSNQS